MLLILLESVFNLCFYAVAVYLTLLLLEKIGKKRPGTWRDWAAARFGAEFPYGTLIVNIIGCFIIGAFMTITTERLIVSPYWRLFVTVGFVGGLTTFSSFSYETLHLLQDADVMRAFYNVGLNILVGFFVTWLGIGAAKLI